MYEHHTETPIETIRFYFRILTSILRAFILVFVSLTFGVFGYHYIENMAWVDAILNASMILGGMGPVDQMKTIEGKLFASFYALYSGIVLIGLMGILLTPVFHRVLHKFHHKK